MNTPQLKDAKIPPIPHTRAPYESETMAMSTLRLMTTTKNVYPTKSESVKGLANTSRSKSPNMPMLYIVSIVSRNVPKG